MGAYFKGIEELFKFGIKNEYLFGFVDMGGAITNIILMSYDLGFHTRLVRIFDREFIKQKLNLPKSVIVDTIIAIGKADKLNEISEYKTKKSDNLFNRV